MIIVKGNKTEKITKEQFDEIVIVHTNETYLTNLLKSFDFGDLNVKFEDWYKNCFGITLVACCRIQ